MNVSVDLKRETPEPSKDAQEVLSALEMLQEGSFVFISLQVPTNLVPRRRVLSPMKTERMSLPKDAALTGSSLCSWQCRR